jgi:hypothetical protein
MFPRWYLPAGFLHGKVPIYYPSTQLNRYSYENLYDKLSTIAVIQLSVRTGFPTLEFQMVPATGSNITDEYSHLPILNLS